MIRENRRRGDHVAAYCAALIAQTAAEACTAVYFGASGRVATARSMDWKATSRPLDHAARGRAERRNRTNSIVGPQNIAASSASGYDIASTASTRPAFRQPALAHVESEYQFDAGSKPGLTIAAGRNMCSTISLHGRRAVEALRQEPFTIITDAVPGRASRRRCISRCPTRRATAPSSNTSAATGHLHDRRCRWR